MFPLLFIFCVMFASVIGPAMIALWGLMIVASTAMMSVQVYFDCNHVLKKKEEEAATDPVESSPINVVKTGKIVPLLHNWTSLHRSIQKYINGNPDGYIHISKWDVSNITNMSLMFYELVKTKEQNDALEGIEEWDMSHVTSTYSMFSECKSFNRPIGKWRLENVGCVSNMFYKCPSFTQSLDEWETTVGKNRKFVSHIHVFAGTWRSYESHKWLNALCNKNNQ